VNTYQKEFIHKTDLKVEIDTSEYEQVFTRTLFDPENNNLAYVSKELD